MIDLTRDQLSEIEGYAKAAYPGECCGLLIGTTEGEDSIAITRIVPSRNLAAETRRDRFEIDPQVQFDTMRELRGGGERIVGHYHSHPDHPAHPSDTDAEMAYEPGLIWIITEVTNGAVTETAAFQALQSGGFKTLTINLGP
ncbi:MAG: M67 family metallopeptidase [Proteobacteria bacterium]|nr:M67 family metallopeptidase [Pseudomonadota bacterium]